MVSVPSAWPRSSAAAGKTIRNTNTNAAVTCRMQPPVCRGSESSIAPAGLSVVGGREAELTFGTEGRVFRATTPDPRQPTTDKADRQKPLNLLRRHRRQKLLHLGVVRSHRLQLRGDRARFVRAMQLVQHDRFVEERLPLRG